MIMTDRGGLSDCDGSGIINAFGGSVTSGRGRFEDAFLFSPTGVSSYYLVLAQSLDKPLVPPHLQSVAPEGSGSFPAGTYYYVITALDGAGGETTVSNEIFTTISSGFAGITLVWYVVPNAFGYNIYRGSTSGSELQMVGVGLPVLQPNPITGTVTFNDTITNPQPTYTLASWSRIHPRNTIFTFATTIPNSIQSGQSFIVTGTSIDGTYTGFSKISSTTLSRVSVFGIPGNISGTGGTIQGGGTSPPVVNTTQQTVLYLMPSGTIPVSYSAANIVAYFPASLNGFGQPPSGGTGGGGTTTAGISGQGNSTPSGGVVGLTSIIPQMVQFTNRVAIALGNGFPPQLYSDATGTPTNPAFTGAIASVSVTGDQVTVTVSGLVTITANNLPLGSNVILSGMSDSSYNGAFPVIAVSPGAGGTFTVRNPTASGGASTGTFTTSTVPITNTFIPAYPGWVTNSQYAVNSVVQPVTTPETYYFIAVQAGVSGGSEPTWTNASVLGQEISDGTIIWKNAGSIQSSAPPPPGAGHIIVYSGSLWVLNTYPSNTASGLDGPCSMRMSDVNNPISWNPINQAFLDKDDGTEGMGFATFTISAEGIPPEGSLVAFKNYAGYQIVGVFGSSNFSIQRIRSDMGCFAPRSIWFVPGYGVARYSHLGVALFDGVQDTVISEEMRPYLFPSNNQDNSDITVADANWIPASQGCLTANPPMYVFAIPIGNSGGQLTRILNYDLVLKCWGGPVDLPFPISSMTQVRPITSNPLTIFGGFSDGTLQRWQAGDILWYTGDPVANTPVLWSMKSPEAFSNPADQKLEWRRLAIRGFSDGAITIAITPYVNGKAKPVRNYTIPSSGDFEVFCGPRLDGLRFNAIISGSGGIEISRLDYQLYPKALGVPSICS